MSLNYMMYSVRDFFQVSMLYQLFGMSKSVFFFFYFCVLLLLLENSIDFIFYFALPYHLKKQNKTNLRTV